MPPPVRPARSEDVELLVTLMREFYAESEYPFREPEARSGFARLVEDPALGRVWLVLSGDEPVGYVAVTFGFSLEYMGRDAFVDDIFVRPAHRGRGLGTATLEFVDRACRELGVRALHLEVERDNQPAQALYRKRGFGSRDRQLLTKILRSLAAAAFVLASSGYGVAAT